MIYNNLIYFLVAIFCFSMAGGQENGGLPEWAIWPLLLVFLYGFDRLVKKIFRRYASGGQSSGYFKAEKRSAIGALVLFIGLVFGLDLKYHLGFLDIGGLFPSFVDIGGLAVFMLLLIVVWLRARIFYQRVFGRNYTPRSFVLSNLAANLPIVTPWILLSLITDLIALFDWPWLNKLYATPYGDMAFFVLFLVFVFIFFPPLIRRLWRCKPLAEGDLRDHLQTFCKKQNFDAGIYLWPLFEGRVITAGVMGVVPGLRYLLITPALIETMNLRELESVVAHEIGHVKRFHLVLYVFLLGSFVISTAFLGEPLYYLFFSQDFFYSLVALTGFSPESLRTAFIVVPTLVTLIFFFRYVFGFFMRNFERQADLHVFPVVGTSQPIISAFEKISLLSGNIRNQPSWHHFGIGERIDFLERCEHDSATIARHHRKVLFSLIVYIAVLASLLFALRQVDYSQAMASYEKKYVAAELIYNANQEENPAHWLYFAGNYFIEHDLEQRAVWAYSLSLERAPEQPEVLNNLAWLLITAKDTALRDPVQALKYARIAAEQKPAGYILDTLAMAWWANGYVDNAVRVEEQARFVDGEQAVYYTAQIALFRSLTYRKEMATEEFVLAEDDSAISGEKS